MSSGDYHADADGVDGIDVPLHAVIEAAPVTRAVVLANQFCKDFCDQFAEAELTPDKKFRITVEAFDNWLLTVGALPTEVGGVTKAADRGRSMLRREARATINRVAAFGKAIWPPFSIDVQQSGHVYDVRLLECYGDKLPGEITAAMTRYLGNKNKHWGQISAFMHSEAVQKRVPEVSLKFIGVERMIAMTIRNACAQLENLNEEVMGAHREARMLLASMKASD